MKKYQLNNNISLNSKMKNDPTIENYIALFHAITDKEQRKIGYYLSGLYDIPEGEKRMAQIDKLRELGCSTKLEHEEWVKKFKRKHRKYMNPNRRYINSRKIKVINPYAGTEEVFKSIQDMCDEYDLEAMNVRSMFSYKKSNKIQYKGLILEKL